jgi:hypothetical protein
MNTLNTSNRKNAENPSFFQRKHIRCDLVKSLDVRKQISFDTVKEKSVAESISKMKKDHRATINVHKYK